MTVSIPYGSIKRTDVLNFLVIIFLVSIPYGSIKSGFVGLFKLGIEVSIPYGSIKSKSKERFLDYAV